MELTFENVIAFCAAVATVSGAINWIMKGVERLKKPNAEQNARLDAIEKKLISDNARLDRVDKRMTKIEETSVLTMEAILALLDDLTGDGSVEKMRETKEHIQKYLVEKNKWI